MNFLFIVYSQTGRKVPSGEAGSFADEHNVQQTDTFYDYADYDEVVPVTSTATSTSTETIVMTSSEAPATEATTTTTTTTTTDPPTSPIILELPLISFFKENIPRIVD